jgi:hypothetical protein
MLKKILIPLYNKLTYLFKIYLFVALCVLTIIVSPNISYAQEKYLGEGSINIWNSNVVWAGMGQFAYIFTVDADGLRLSNIQEITNLIINTDYGDITFDSVIDTSDAGRFADGQLFSEQDITEIRIIKAIGVVDGKMLDLTDIISIYEFTPVKIIGK